ncbi:MAG: NADH-quinone oxidoreductase subunit K, partial [Chloroflexota bacterium]|nr:NADH-quinone oxidoreductase subunit K [Chloroflexota bacterium]
MSAEIPYLDAINTSLTAFLFLIGLFCLLTRRNTIKQVIGLKIMLQGVTLSLVHAGYLLGDTRLAETMVISALVVEIEILGEDYDKVTVQDFYPSYDGAPGIKQKFWAHLLRDAKEL